MALVLLLISGCTAWEKSKLVDGYPPETYPLWTQVEMTADPNTPRLCQLDDDIFLEGFGQLLGFWSLPDGGDSLAALAWQNGIASFYSLDLAGEEVVSLGAIALLGEPPTIEAMDWPWVLLGAQDEGGNHSWVLLDFSAEGDKIIWQASHWVPLGMRRQPVWYSGGKWYMGPVFGPYFTDILSGEKVCQFEGGLNPVTNHWPSWAGGTPGGPFYLMPREEGSLLIDLAEGGQVALNCDRGLAWNAGKTWVAWQEGESLGLATTTGQSRVIVSEGVVPQQPLWSAEGDNLLFLKGSSDLFGTCCRELWLWTEKGGSRKLFTLPENWPSWQLLAAVDDAVLAQAGDSGELIIYFDVAGGKMYELEDDGFAWQEGELVALYRGSAVRFAPGKDPRIIFRDVEDLEVIALVDRYFIYSLDGIIHIKQLVQ